MSYSDVTPETLIRMNLTSAFKLVPIGDHSARAAESLAAAGGTSCFPSQALYYHLNRLERNYPRIVGYVLRLPCFTPHSTVHSE